MAHTVADIEAFLTYLLDRVTLKDKGTADHLKAVLSGQEDPEPEGTSDGSEPGTDATDAGRSGSAADGAQPAGPDQPAAPAGTSEPF